LFIGGPIKDNKDKVAQANPITYVTRNDPPMLLMHGDKDQSVIFNQSELLYAAQKKAGATATLYKVKGGGHGFGGAQDSREKLFGMVVAFFDKHLQDKTEPKK